MAVGNIQDERNLLMQIAEGDREAFSSLFKLYYQKLGNYLFKITKNREITEEIVQEVFIKIWINRKALIEINNFQAYLFTISKNRVLNFLRDKSREKVHELKLIKELEETYHSLETNSLRDEYYLIIDDAVSQLPPQQQTIYRLIRHEKLKYDDIAVKTGLSKETIRKHMHLALASLKKNVKLRIEGLAVYLLFLILFF